MAKRSSQTGIENASVGIAGSIDAVIPEGVLRGHLAVYNDTKDDASFDTVLESWTVSPFSLSLSLSLFALN
jgi:hypothetical protein